jgi:hypothetical protein
MEGLDRLRAEKVGLACAASHAAHKEKGRPLGRPFDLLRVGGLVRANAHPKRMMFINLASGQDGSWFAVQARVGPYTFRTRSIKGRTTRSRAQAWFDAWLRPSCGAERSRE